MDFPKEELLEKYVSLYEKYIADYYGENSKARKAEHEREVLDKIEKSLGSSLLAFWGKGSFLPVKSAVIKKSSSKLLAQADISPLLLYILDAPSNTRLSL